MDILSVSFTESGNEATLRTDLGFYSVTKADFRSFSEKYLGEDFEAEFSGGNDIFPLFAGKDAEDELILLDEKLKVMKYALYLLGISDKSEKTLRTKLRTKGYSTRASDEAIAVIKKNGYLDDKSFCKRKCEQLANGKLFGRRRLISELLAKGFSYELCCETVDMCDADFDENLRILFEKITKGKTPTEREQKKKLSDKLLRYGYSYDEINSIFEEYISDI